MTYHAHTQNTSDSGDSGCRNTSTNPLSRLNGEVRRRAWKRAATPGRNSSQSSSDLSSPSETCYSFVRKALKRFSSGSLGQSSYGSLASLQCYRTCKRPWLVAYNSFDSDIPSRPRGLNPDDSANEMSRDCSFNSEDIDGLPIELRDLDEVVVGSNKPAVTSASSTPSFFQPIKSKSLGDILGMLHMFLRPRNAWSSVSSDSSSSSSWSRKNWRQKKESKNRMLKSRSSFNILARNESSLQTAISSGDKIREDDLVNDNFDANITREKQCNHRSTLGSRDRINGNTIVTDVTSSKHPPLPTCQPNDGITPNIMDSLDKSASWLVNDVGCANNFKSVKCRYEDNIQEVNKRNSVISEDRMKRNLSLFNDRCTRLSEEKVFEYYLSGISRIRSMPNLRFRCSNQSVRKQASLDEQVLFDSNQKCLDMPKDWLCHKNGDDSNVERTDMASEDFSPTDVLHLKNRSVQATMDDTCSQLLKNRHDTSKKHISCDDTALLSSRYVLLSIEIYLSHLGANVQGNPKENHQL